MSLIRLIARLDVKGPNLIKGVQLEGLKVLGDPHEFARRYYNDGIDEIIYMDSVASLYQRNSILGLVESTARDVFVPITVGGGMRKVEDVRAALRAGADKIAVNTAAIARPELITEIANNFGAQCVVLSIEAKRVENVGWRCFTDNGRERTSLDPIDWARQGAELGAGEILLTSVDQEGTCRGYDVPLTRAVSEAVDIPVIASGGMGKFNDLAEVVSGGADAAAIASVLHYDQHTIPELRNLAAAAGIDVRAA